MMCLLHRNFLLGDYVLLVNLISTGLGTVMGTGQIRIPNNTTVLYSTEIHKKTFLA